ncbi:MAG: TonB-dependent receptor [Prevotellaceae bacterium]|jgi:iron complex outermembrane receptor protein|nr:TonB-dependent receptor [Prevotellaceae bacterium]
MKKGLLFAAGFVLASCPLRAQTVLDSVVVSATRANDKTPVAQATIYQTDIEAQRIGRDLPYLLELLPSVVGYSDNGAMIGSTSFRIRGADASRINISIDGVPLNDAESQSVFWVNIPDLGAISRSLQLQRGVGTSSFGSSAFGGLLNIATRPALLQAGAHFESSYGSFNTWNAAAGVSSGLLHDAFAFDARYGYVSSDGYLDHSGMWQQTLHLNGAWYGKNQLLKASVLYGEQHSQLSFEGVQFENLTDHRRKVYTENAAYYPNETDNYQQTHVHLHYLYHWNEAWKLNATAYYTKGKGYTEQYKSEASLTKYNVPAQVMKDPENPSKDTTYTKSDLIRQKGLDNDFYGLNISALYDAERLHLTAGAGANRYDGDHYGKVLWTRRNTGNIDYNRDWYTNTGVKDELNIFAKASYDLPASLSLFADVQLRNVRFKMHGMDDDYYEKQAANPSDLSAGVLDHTYQWLFLNPKVGLSYSPDKRHNVFVSFAVGNREPNRSDLKDADKNGIRTPAKAERLYDWEAGYTFRPAFGQFGVNLYYMNYRDQIVATGRVNDAYRLIMENVPESYRAGIELTAVARLVNPLQVEATFTWSRNKLKNYTNYVDEDYGATTREEYFRETTIAFSPGVVASAAVRYFPLKSLSLALTGKYVGKQFYDNTQTGSRSLDAYFSAGFHAGYNFPVAAHTNAFVQLLVNNLFNALYCTSAFVEYRSVFSDGSPDYQDLRYFPQAGRNWMLKIGIQF